MQKNSNSKFSVFALPSELLTRATQIHTLGAESEAKLDAKSVENESSAAKARKVESESETGNGCATCGVQFFATVDIQRSHFRGAWHATNLRRRIRNKDTLNESDFLNLASNKEEDSDSDSDSNSSISNSGDEQHLDVNFGSGSPFFAFLLTANPQNQSSDQQQQQALYVYKQLLYNKSRTEYPDSDSAILLLKKLQTQPQQNWILIMFSSGHFAGAVFEAKAGNPVLKEHKAFHRYTTRRKQGGAQNASDNANGKAKSAGSNLRRHNEMMLEQEIQSLLQQWAPFIHASSRIFIRCPPRNARKIVFFDEKLLTSNDSRIRGFPFITHRPTIPELTRAFIELTTVTVRDFTPPIEKKLSQTPPPPISSPEIKSLNISTSEPEQLYAIQTLPEPFAKLIDLCKRGKTDLLRAEITNLVDINTILPADTATLLHAAAFAGHAETVAYLLKAGADPTIRDIRQRPAYLVADSKDVRDAFRRAYAEDIVSEKWKWDWTGGAAVPSPLNAETENRQREKDREKRKKQKARAKENADARKEELAAARAAREVEDAREKKEAKEKAERDKNASVFAKLAKNEREAIGMTLEKRMQLDREKRALAAEARFRAQQGKCSSCAKLLTPTSTFEKFQYKYCSVECVNNQFVLHQ
ncbi:hypothetical protein HK100_000665 [Physocladia obscura]|uniref:VLRF1 domain-containing protein n=1 Tax=Physocladia obscura TaxID=109957 RepID=A0AAD5T0K9_9FUNG|nr:hypothetical protein HK100_000665 [Physocladia obscura]